MASAASKGDDEATWKRCSTCRGPIDFGTTYYVCSVSTCNRKRLTYRFCTVECWEEHLPMMRHREAWAVEETAPTRKAWEAESAPAPSGNKDPSSELAAAESKPGKPRARDGAPRRRIRVGSAPAAAVKGPQEVLVVVSRFKNFVKEAYGMNTSDAVMEVLSGHLRSICRRAAQNAQADGRKTIMDRDFEFLRRR